MRGTRQRPSSLHGPNAPWHGSARPGRKVFNCIVDDSALVAGVKKSTRNGIRQWVKNGQIRLFVPLHALEQLSQQKNANNRHGEDVRDTLQWLDDATSRFPNVVTLQGPEDVYEHWAEVEKFVVPRTLFSEDDALDQAEPGAEDEADVEAEVEALPDGGMSKLTLADITHKTPVSSMASDASRSVSPSSMRSQRSSVSAISPPTSPAKAISSPAKPATAQSDPTASSTSTVPFRLQSLFNYILWRIHQEANPVAALESFIFLCNDQSKVNFAKGFEIRTKRLEQLREAIGREDRDYRNRQMVMSRETQTPAAASATPQKKDDDDDDEVVFKPPPRAPAAMRSKQQEPTQPNVMDPDVFGRNVAPVAQALNGPPPHSPQPHQVLPQVPGGGAPLPFGSRGNPRGNFRGGGARGRGANFGRGRGQPGNRVNGTFPNGQIDPNSFARPRGAGYTGQGGRKLWTPS